MKRFQHRIKDNKKCELPYHYLFFDTETHQKKIGKGDIQHFLKLGVALYWRRRPDRGKDTLKRLKFTNPEEFWDFVEDCVPSRSRLVITAHNLEFDVGIVQGFKALSNRGYEPTKLIIDNRRQIWKFRKDDKTLLFLDNMNYFSTSLKTLGESIGEAKLSMPGKQQPLDDWWAYCEQDVNVMYKAWQFWLNFISDNELGNFGLTIASQAFNAYRHRFYKAPIFIHNSNKAVKLERTAYRGGRNECFQLGELPKQQYHLLDINSMYPHVMATGQYPVNLKSTGKELTLEKLRFYLKTYSVIAEVVVDTPEPCFAIKQSGKLLFPIGQFRATLTSSELLYGLIYGYIKEVYNYSLYEKGDIFKAYVKFFYGKRQEFAKKGNKVYVYLCKLMLNSLYGKFGQKSEVWEKVGMDYTREYDYWTEFDYKTRETHTYRAVNYLIEECKGYDEGFNSLVSIPAEITANARLYLWKLIKTAGLDNVFYCDTDSILVNNEGLSRLKDYLDPSLIGKLKTQQRPTKVILKGLKDYIMGRKVKIKGIPKKAKKLDDNTYVMYRSIGIKTGLHKKDINKVVWKRTLKHLKRIYNKGVVLQNNRVIPLTMEYQGGENVCINIKTETGYRSR